MGQLGGFPGPYASYVYKTIGPSGLLSLLRGRADRSAEFVSAVAYVDERGGRRVFVGRLGGRLSKSSLGSEGFGFDPIFIPQGETRTLAELTLAEVRNLPQGEGVEGARNVAEVAGEQVSFISLTLRSREGWFRIG